MRLERLAVILALVAEDAPKLPSAARCALISRSSSSACFRGGRDRAASAWLVERRPPLLPLRIVGLRDVDGDHPVGVAGEHRRPAVRRVGEKLEGEPGVGIFVPVAERQARAGERVDEPALRGLEAVPRELDARLREIRDHARQPARDAQRIRIAVEDGPVAHRLLGVVAAETIAARRRVRQRRPPQLRVRRVRIERTDQRQVRKIGDPALAIQANGVLEEKQLAAVVAMEYFHGSPE